MEEENRKEEKVGKKETDVHEVPTKSQGRVFSHPLAHLTPSTNLQGRLSLCRWRKWSMRMAGVWLKVTGALGGR